MKKLLIGLMLCAVGSAFGMQKGAARFVKPGSMLSRSFAAKSLPVGVKCREKSLASLAALRRHIDALEIVVKKFPDNPSHYKHPEYMFDAIDGLEKTVSKKLDGLEWLMGQWVQNKKD